MKIERCGDEGMELSANLFDGADKRNRGKRIEKITAEQCKMER